MFLQELNTFASFLFANAEANERLRSTADEAEFLHLLAQEFEKLGLALDKEAAKSTMAAARVAWLERRVELT